MKQIKLPNYYRILGISPLADQDRVRRAYRALAKRYHPDTYPPERQAWAKKQMTRINAAYQILQDAQRRADYDRQRGYAAPPPAGASTPGADAGSTTLWRRQRARERARRRQARRWQRLATASAVALAAGILIALLAARTRPAGIIVIAINGAIAILLAASLIMANR